MKSSLFSLSLPVSSSSSLMAEADTTEDDEVEGVQDKLNEAMVGGAEMDEAEVSKEDMDVEEADKAKVFEDGVDDEDKAEVDDKACF